MAARAHAKQLNRARVSDGRARYERIASAQRGRTTNRSMGDDQRARWQAAVPCDAAGVLCGHTRGTKSGLFILVSYRRLPGQGTDWGWSLVPDQHLSYSTRVPCCLAAVGKPLVRAW